VHGKDSNNPYQRINPNLEADLQEDQGAKSLLSAMGV
jgi:hypothetical protein